MAADGAADGPVFDEGFRRQLDLLIRWRRDVRRFRPNAVDPSLVEHMLELARSAPSVGYSQPTRFVLVESPAARAAVRENFVTCNRQALAEYGGARAQLYARLKLAGLDEAPVHLAVFCDDGTVTGHGLGRRTMPEMLRYSVVTAVQTLWLALRAGGLGMGWVSILDPGRLARDLDVPPSWALIAYCCIGYPEQEQEQPELLRAGWEQPSEQMGITLRR
jgi:5,6-dimethylbenzimidazole synthase